MQIPDKARESKIDNVKFDNTKLIFTLENGYVFTVSDCASECCEIRYMVCDDDLSFFKGSYFQNIVEKTYKEIESDPNLESYHEVVFVEVISTKGSCTLVCHNEHNGYYGGFDVEVKEL